MARVERQSVKANIRTIATRLDEALRSVMTLLAQALKRTEPKFIDIAVVWLDVIANRRCRDGAAFQAIFAKRVLKQLVLPDPGPASGAVPLVPFRRLSANAHGSIHHCRPNSSTAW
jgi:hypothetical protein